MTKRLARRDFIRQIGQGVTGGFLARQSLASEPTSPGSGDSPAVHGAGETGIAIDVGTVRDLPTRPLGRVGLQLPPLSFGTAAMGHALYEAEPFEDVMNAAIDAGIRYIDTARIYDVAEERLRPVLAKRRQGPGRLVADEHRQQAFDYALSIPGVATCVVGMKTLDELRLAIQGARRFQPLDGARRQSILAKGAEMAKEWGPHFGDA